MNKRWLFLGAALIVPVVLLSGCLGGSTSAGPANITSQQQGIWVNGSAKMMVAPDIATLSLGVEAQADTVATAQSQAAAAMDRVVTALKSGGVAENDIQTQYFNISPVIVYDQTTQQPVTTGYQVTNTVTAKIRDIANVGSIIDATAAAGSDLTRINNLSFSVDDPSIYNSQLRGEAMANAQATAGQLAQLAGVTLGKVTYVSESASAPPPIYQVSPGGAPAPAPATPISPGQTEVSLSVQVVYAISN